MCCKFENFSLQAAESSDPVVSRVWSRVKAAWILTCWVRDDDDYDDYDSNGNGTD